MREGDEATLRRCVARAFWGFDVRQCDVATPCRGDGVTKRYRDGAMECHRDGAME